MATGSIDVRPDTLHISAYGGDTLEFTVLVDYGFVAGKEWNAQVRANREPGTPIDATFVIEPPTMPGQAATLRLLAEDTARLAGTGALVQRKLPDGTIVTTQVYTGEWDCQVSAPGGADPVTTLVQGSITLDYDVTRLAA